MITPGDQLLAHGAHAVSKVLQFLSLGDGTRLEEGQRMRLLLMLLLSVVACAPPAPGLRLETGTRAPDTDAGTAPNDAGALTIDGGATDAGSQGHSSLCGAARPGLHDVTGTPAGPYLVHHPVRAGPVKHTVLFLPGGDSSKDTSEQFIWPLWLANGRGVDDVRVVIPYTHDGELGDEQDRIVAIAAEVLSCFGGDPAHVHLAGTSMGGLAAFETMKRTPAPFATLLGAPGAFRTGVTATDLSRMFTGKAVFVGVGELDEALWKNPASAIHTRLTSLGYDSTFVEFRGQGHILDAAFDESVFFDFWLAH